MIFLLYVGIRILLASAGKQQEKYKEMLISWGQGVILLLFFPILLYFVITINHAFVGMIEEKTAAALNIVPSTTNVDLSSIKNPSADADNEAIAQNLDSNVFESNPDANYMAKQAARAKSKTIADAVVFLIMVFQFILLLIAYYKRLFMTGFLISIFPIVMILYPIDKINDGKSQSFSSWAKELFLNIFTQTFHAICYIFVMAATEAASGDWILALVAVTFLFKAEEVIKNILGLGGSSTVTSPAASMAKAAVALGAVSTISNTFSSTAEKVVTGSRMMREARTMGYKTSTLGLSKKTRNEKREKLMSERYNALLTSPYNPSNYNRPETGVDLSGAAVAGPTENQADKIGNVLQDADVAQFNQNGNDPMTFAMMAAINNPKNDNLAKSLEEKGLTKNGKKSLATLSQATSEFQNSMLGLDPNSSNYKERVKKIKGKFDERIKVAFPGANEKARKNMAHAAYKAMRMGAGIKNNKNFDLDESRKAFDNKRRQIAGKNAVVDMDNLKKRKENGGMGLFAQEDYTDRDGNLKLFGYAKQMESKYFDALSKDEKCSKLSLKDRKQMAKDLAVLATTREQSKLSNDELRENFLALKGKSKSTPAEGKRVFTMSNSMQMFTAKTTLDAAERLQSANVTQLDGALDDIVLEGVGSEKLEAYKEDLGDDTLGFGADMEDVLAIVDEVVVEEAGVEINEDNPETLLGAMGVYEDRLEGEERTAATEENRREVAKKANKSNKEAVKKSKQRKDVKKKEAGRSTKMTIEQAMQIQNEMHGKPKTEDQMDNPFDTFNLKEEIVRSQLEAAGAAAALQSEIDRVSGGDLSGSSEGGATVESILGGSADSYVSAEATPVSQEDFWINSSLVDVREEKERQLIEGLDFLLGQDDENIDMPDIGPNVDGYTEKQYIDKAKDLNRKGREKILEALATAGGMGVAATTTGAMAIGLNTGANPMQEWLAGTAAGAAALNGFGFRDKQSQIKVQDADGNVYTVDIQKYGTGADDLALMKPDASGVYKLEDLIAVNPDFGQKLELQINDQKAGNVREKEEEGKKLAEERASRRAGRISGALDSRRNNRNS